MVREAKTSDAKVCAEIFYSAGPMVSNYLFASDEKTCIAIIEELFNKPTNMFSKEYCFVDEDENKNITGAIWIVKGSHKNKSEKAIGKYSKDLMKHLSLKKIMQIVIRNILFAKYMSGIKKDEYYVAALAVLTEHRQKGVATKLLKKGEEVAFQNNFKKVSLFVEIGNETAKKAYIKNGYKLVNRIVTPQRYAKHKLFGFEKMVCQLL